MRVSILFCSLLPLLFLQGCGLSGAYIFFGDRSWKEYRSALKARQFEDAKSALKRAHGYYKDSLTYDDARYPLVYCKLAETEFRGSGNLRKSLNWIQQGLSVLPENEDLLAMRGKFKFFYSREKGDSALLDKAKDDYRGALLKRPLDPQFNAGLMQVFFYEIEQNTHHGREKRNSYLYSQVQDLAETTQGDESPHVMDALGVLAYLQKDYAQAISLFSKVLKLDPPDFETKRTQFYLSRAYVETRQFQEAIDLTTSLLELYPDDPVLSGERILAYFKKGERSAATLELQKYEDSQPQDHEFFYRLGLFFYESNLAPKAELYLLKAYRLDSNNGNYALALGNNYLLQGKKDAARRFFQKAEKLAPSGSALERSARQKTTEVGG